MLTIPLILFVVALALSGLNVIQSGGTSVLGWACVFLSLGLLWTSLPR